MTFEYMKVQTSMDSIDVDDIGNVTLKCSNDSGYEWFLKIKTELGWSEVIQYGPLKINENKVDFSFILMYNKFEFNEKKLYKNIDNFINYPKRDVTSVDIISNEEFNTRIGGIKDGIW